MKYVNEFDHDKERKTRIHPSEAHHRMDKLEDLPDHMEEGDGVDAAALVRSLGLSISGEGKGTALWFVGFGKANAEKKS